MTTKEILELVGLKISTNNCYDDKEFCIEIDPEMDHITFNNGDNPKDIILEMINSAYWDGAYDSLSPILRDMLAEKIPIDHFRI